jgi:hypothetical protein
MALLYITYACYIGNVRRGGVVCYAVLFTRYVYITMLVGDSVYIILHVIML